MFLYRDEYSSPTSLVLSAEALSDMTISIDSLNAGSEVMFSNASRKYSALLYVGMQIDRSGWGLSSIFSMPGEFAGFEYVVAPE